MPDFYNSQWHKTSNISYFFIKTLSNIMILPEKDFVFQLLSINMIKKILIENLNLKKSKNKHEMFFIPKVCAIFIFTEIRIYCL